jgi:hypothetical protein
VTRNAEQDDTTTGGPEPRWRRAARAVADLPLAFRVVLFAIAVLHAVGLSWGMPASDAWDVDGVAPRDFLPGLAATYTPGEFYTYPPLHLAILTVLTAPVTLLAALHANSTSVPDVLRVIIQPPYMTAMAMIARVVTLAMSLGVVVALSRIAAELVPSDDDGGIRKRNTAIAAAIAAGVGVPFTYYSHVTNLDVPYNFWAAFATLGIVRAVVRHEPRRMRNALLLAACAVATKDQAYAVFLLGMPMTLAAWLALDGWARERENAKAILKETVIGGVLAIIAVLVIDGAITNPSGFRSRLTFLSGSASQDFATYSRDLPGRWRLLRDLGAASLFHYPALFVALIPIGLVSIVRGTKKNEQRAAALVPLMLATSFTIAFNAVARRVEERFTLPQVLMLSIYAGIAIERGWFGRSRSSSSLSRVAARLACVGIVGWSLWRCIELDANLVLEPRYRCEAWLKEHVRPGDVIETYGLNVYLPRFPPGAHVVRVGSSPPNKRSPMPGIEEVQAPYLEIDRRRPEYVVVSECYSWRWIQLFATPLEGRVIPKTMERLASDDDGVRFFNDLFVKKLGYDLVEISHFEHPIFRRVELHASVSCPMYVLERRRGAQHREQ